jgi:glycosyltransferase involved in cell wall biosynthesis
MNDMPALSVMIPTWNCAALLAETLASVLAQDEPGLDITVVDDCSTRDDPEAVVNAVGGGRVRFVRQERNVGAIRNFNACVRLARGELIHILHGDDFVRPGFHRAILDAAVRHPDIGLFCTRADIVDEHGAVQAQTTRLVHLLGGSRDIRPLVHAGNQLVTPAVVVRRSAYLRLGLFEESLVHVADWEMWVRVTAACGGVFLDQTLAAYRVFAAQDTTRLKLTGENLRDHLRLAELWSRVLPGFERRPFLRLVESMAMNQIAEFASRGRTDAVAANRGLLDEVRALLVNL